MKNSNTLHKLFISICALLGLSLLSCAPSLAPAVKDAEYSFKNLQSDSEVQKHASSDEEAKHLAYLTEQKIMTAHMSAKQRALEEQIRALHAARGDMRARIHERSAIAARRQVRELESEIASLQSALSEFETRQTERGFEVTLSDVVFETDRADLKSGAEQRLRPLAEHLRENSNKIAQIEGHTDNVGSVSYNLQLSDRRANSVKDAMVRMGVPREKLIARGFGKDKPITSNDTPEGRLQNRRVEIIIVSMGQN
jgi:outer membrane protein OmpA-like peptidoglycan-associated protein